MSSPMSIAGVSQRFNQTVAPAKGVRFTIDEPSETVECGAVRPTRFRELARGRRLSGITRTMP